MIESGGLTLGIFLLIGLGALCRRIGLLRYDDRTALNNIIIFIALPSLIFLAAKQAPFDRSLLIVSAVALTVSLSSLGIGWILAKLLRLQGAAFGAFLLAAGVGNTGYLGYPLTQALFGQKHLVKAVFFDIFGTVLVLFTAGIYFAGKYGKSDNRGWRQGATYAAPNLIALALGFAFQGIVLPTAPALVISSLADATVGIIMLSIGISLSGNLRQLDTRLAAITALKLGVMPLLAFLLGLALKLPPVLKEITLLQSSMPVALMTFIIGDRYDLDRGFLSAAILASTVLSMITVPFWQSVA